MPGEICSTIHNRNNNRLLTAWCRPWPNYVDAPFRQWLQLATIGIRRVSGVQRSVLTATAAAQSAAQAKSTASDRNTTCAQCSNASRARGIVAELVLLAVVAP